MSVELKIKRMNISLPPYLWDYIEEIAKHLGWSTEKVLSEHLLDIEW